MVDDAELLRQYSRAGSQDAFAELVRRHIALVYSATVPRVGGDTHLAEDIVQEVFRDLARKAPSVARRGNVAGWLYIAARYSAAEAVRAERRRRTREETFATVNPPGPEAEVDRAALDRLLDAAIDGLKPGDREAILLRFYERRSFSEVGASLGLSEDASQKRVGRALERLKLLFIRSGVTSTAASLAALLADRALAPAPDGLADRVAHGAGTSAGIGSGAGYAAMALGGKAGVVGLVGFLAAILAFYSVTSALHRLAPAPAAAPRNRPAAAKTTAAGRGALPFSEEMTPDARSEFARAAALDPEWLALFRRNPEVMRSFLRMLGEASPALGMEVADELTRHGFEYTRDEVLRGWTSGDPVAAWKWALDNDEVFIGPSSWGAVIKSGKIAEIAEIVREMPGDTSEAQARRRAQARYVATYWTAQDPAAVAAWIETLPADQRLRDEALNGYANGRATRDPPDAAGWAAGMQKGSGYRSSALQAAAMEWVKVAPVSEVDAWVESAADGPDFDRALSAVAKAYVQKDNNAASALALLPRISPGPSRDIASVQGVSTYAPTSPETAIGFFETISSPSGRQIMIGQIAEKWAILDPAGARRFLDSENPLSAPERAVIEAALEKRAK